MDRIRVLHVVGFTLRRQHAVARSAWRPETMAVAPARRRLRVAEIRVAALQERARVSVGGRVSMVRHMAGALAWPPRRVAGVALSAAHRVYSCRAATRFAVRREAAGGENGADAAGCGPGGGAEALQRGHWTRAAVSL